MPSPKKKKRVLKKSKKASKKAFGIRTRKKPGRKKVSRKISPTKKSLSKPTLEQQLIRLKKEQRLNRLKLAVFKEIGKTAQQKVDRHRILSRTMELCLKALDSESGTLFLYDEKRHELVFQVVKGPKQTVKALQGQKSKAGEGIVGHVLKTGKPYVTHDVNHDQKWHRQISEQLKYQTHDLLCAPLRSGEGKPLGAIQVLNRKHAEKYTKDDLDVLVSIAHQIAMVWENANLFLALSKRVQQQKDLHEISQILTSTLDTFEVRKTALQAVVQLMNCETGSLYQIDTQKKELYFDVVLGEQREAVKKIRLQMGEGIAGWVAQKGKAVLIADCSKDKRFQKKVDKLSQFKTRNMLCAPLRFKKDVIGVLQAINRKDNTFSLEDLVLFEDLANQVAIALKNAMLFEDLRNSFYESVTALAEAIELRDPYTGGHTQRVRRYSLAIGRQLGISAEELERLSLSAILHDVGKIGVADRILRKKGKLEYDEFLEMKKHPGYGYTMLKNVSFLSLAYDGILYHHERYDGKGYPKGLKGEKIPLLARIIAVADTFDAMTTNRPYRDGLSLDFVLNEIQKCAGSQFDPKVAQAFLKAFEIGQIQLD